MSLIPPQSDLLLAASQKKITVFEPQVAPPVSISAGYSVKGVVRYAISWAVVTPPAGNTPSSAALFVQDMRWLVASAKQSSALISTQVINL